MAARMERAQRAQRNSAKQRQQVKDNVLKSLHQSPLKNLDLILATLPTSTIKPDEKVHYLNFFVKEYCKGELTETLYSILPESLQQLFNKLRPLLFAEHVQLRAAALRACRHLISDATSANLLTTMGLPLFVSMSMEAAVHRQHESERAQAFGVARQLLRMGADGLKGIVSTLVQIGLDYNDPCQVLAVEVLCEAAVYNPKLVAYADGFQVMVAAALDCKQASHNPRNMAIVQSLLYVANTPQGREFFHPPTILCSLLAPILDPDYVHVSALTPAQDASLVHNSSPQQTRAARTGASRLAVVYMMRSWAGLCTLASSKTGLSALIQMLLNPMEESSTLSTLVAMIFQLLLLSLPAWSDDFSEAIACRAPQQYSPTGLQRRETRPDLLDSYRASVVMALAQAGLVDALIQVITSPNSDIFIRTRSTVLLSDVSELVGTLLPHHHGNQIQFMPLLTTLACSASASPAQRALAHEACANLSYGRRVRARTYHRPPVPMDVGEKLRHLEAERDTFFLRPTDYAVSASQDVIARRFAHSLKMSRILERDQDWAWSYIPELVASPLLYPTADTPMPATRTLTATDLLANGRAIDSLLSYFGSPYYIEEKLPEATPVATQLISKLIATEAGAAIIRESGFFATLIKAFQDISFEAPVLSLSAVEDTNARDYPLLLSCILINDRGDQLIKPYIKYIVACMDGRNQRLDLARLLIKHLKPMNSSVAREVLEATFDRGSPRFQMICLDRLDEMAVPSSADPVKEFNQWLITVLIKGASVNAQGKGGSGKSKGKSKGITPRMVYDRAMRCLTALSGTTTIAGLFISHLDKLKQLGRSSNYLLIRLLGSPDAFKQIQTSMPGFIDQQWKDWTSRRCLTYVEKLERSMTAELWQFSKNHEHSRLLLPTHLYRSLAGNLDGANYLKSKGVVKELFAQLDAGIEAMEENPSTANLLQVKAALWSLGNLGGTVHGQSLLSDEQVAKLCRFAESCQVASIRGTCFFTLSLMTRCEEGCRRLTAQGWTVKSNTDERLSLQQVCVALPRDVPSFFKLDMEDAGVHYASTLADISRTASSSDESDIIKLLNDCTDVVEGRKALQALHVLKQSEPELFETYHTLLKVRRHVDQHAIPLKVRRELNELFDSATAVNNMPLFIDQTSLPSSPVKLERAPLTPAKPIDAESNAATNDRRSSLSRQARLSGSRKSMTTVVESDEKSEWDISNEPGYQEDWDAACRLVFSDLLAMDAAQRAVLVATFSQDTAARWERHARLVGVDPWEGMKEDLMARPIPPQGHEDQDGDEPPTDCTDTVTSAQPTSTDDPEPSSIASEASELAAPFSPALPEQPSPIKHEQSSETLSSDKHFSSTSLVEMLGSDRQSCNESEDRPRSASATSPGARPPASALIPRLRLQTSSPRSRSRKSDSPSGSFKSSTYV